MLSGVLVGVSLRLAFLGHAALFCGGMVGSWHWLRARQAEHRTAAVLDMISFTYMRSEVDLTPFGPAQRVAIAAWTRRGVLDAAAPEDDRRPMPLGDSVESELAVVRQNG